MKTLLATLALLLPQVAAAQVPPILVGCDGFVRAEAEGGAPNSVLGRAAAHAIALGGAEVEEATKRWGNMSPWALRQEAFMAARNEAQPERCAAMVRYLDAVIAQSPFTVRSGHRERTLPYATAYFHDGRLKIALGSDFRPNCGFNAMPDQRRIFIFEVPPGPGGRFYAGMGAVGVRTSDLDRERETVSGLSEAHIGLDLEPFEAKKGAVIRGAVSMITAKGSFEAKICNDPTAPIPSLPEDAPKGPVTVQPNALKFTRGLALVSIKGEYTHIGAVRLYAAEKVGCAQRGGLDKMPSLNISSIGGASKNVPAKGRRVPAMVSLLDIEPRFPYPSDGWIRLDEVSFEIGDQITGAVVARSRDGGATAAGRFTAMVCPLSPPKKPGAKTTTKAKRKGVRKSILKTLGTKNDGVGRSISSDQINSLEAAFGGPGDSDAGAK